MVKMGQHRLYQPQWVDFGVQELALSSKGWHMGLKSAKCHPTLDQRLGRRSIEAFVLEFKWL